MTNKDADRFYKKMDSAQREYYEKLTDKETICVCCDCPSGFGKTAIAVLAGLQGLEEGRYSKLYYITVPSDRSLRLGFLPGSIDDKISICATPFFNVAEELGYDEYRIEDMIREGRIVFVSDVSLRGTTIDNSFAILDEFQNAHLPDMKLVLTRIKDNCKVALIGSHLQNDNYKTKDNSFVDMIEHLIKKPWAVKCSLLYDHRGKLSSWVEDFVPEGKEKK